MSRFRRPDPRAGIAATEFALIAPVVLLLMLATADLAGSLRVQMRVDETASELAEVVTQYQQLYAGDFPTLFNAAQQMAGSTPVTGTFGASIISGIVNAGDGPTIAWQQKSPGVNGFKSQFGSLGSTPTLPDNYSVPAGESLITTEIFTQATAWVLSVHFMGGPGNTVFGAYALFQPRSALLSQITAGNRP
jgi:Flp pilus assembly protein TadG